MEALSPLVPLLQTVGFPGLVLLLVLTGYLVPRSTHQETVAERDRYRDMMWETLKESKENARTATQAVQMATTVVEKATGKDGGE